MFLLLSGAGVGYSVQQEHIWKMPEVEGVSKEYKKIFVVPDSIEGWSDAIKELVESHFYFLPEVVFDYSKIRSKGSEISGGFLAPGYKPLEKAIELIELY